MAKKSTVPAPKKSKSKKEETPVKDVVFKEISVELEAEIDAERAKELLGWEEEDVQKFGGEYLLFDVRGKKIRANNNLRNRPLYSSSIDKLKQTILTRKWKYNGEPIIITAQGEIANGQHTLLSIVLAEQERTLGKNADHWKSVYGEEEVKVKKAIIFGIDGSDDTLNTMDTCKARSLSDVIYRSEYFSKYKSSERSKVSGIAALAVQFLWARTGAKNDAYAPYHTHAEYLDFIERHPKLVKAVSHIYEENSEGKIKNIISPGYAVGLLYLFATSGSDPEQYAKSCSEKHCDFDLWDKACEYWVLLASGSTAVMEAKHALAALHSPDGSAGGTIAEKHAVLIKGFFSFAQYGEVRKQDVQLKYVDTEFGQVLAANPICGGLDVGSGKPESKDSSAEDESSDPPPPTEEEIAEEARKAKIERETAKGSEEAVNEWLVDSTPSNDTPEHIKEQREKLIEMRGGKPPHPVPSPAKKPPIPKKKEKSSIS